MKRRYHEIIGLKVIDARGKSLGHVVDLAAKACGNRLVVQAMLVGPAAFLARIGSKDGTTIGFETCREIPWSAVAKLGETIELGPDWEDDRRRNGTRA